MPNFLEHCESAYEDVFEGRVPLFPKNQLGFEWWDEQVPAQIKFLAPPAQVVINKTASASSIEARYNPLSWTASDSRLIRGNLGNGESASLVSFKIETLRDVNGDTSSGNFTVTREYEVNHDWVMSGGGILMPTPCSVCCDYRVDSTENAAMLQRITISGFPERTPIVILPSLAQELIISQRFDMSGLLHPGNLREAVRDPQLLYCAVPRGNRLSFKLEIQDKGGSKRSTALYQGELIIDDPYRFIVGETAQAAETLLQQFTVPRQSAE